MRRPPDGRSRRAVGRRCDSSSTPVWIINAIVSLSAGSARGVVYLLCRTTRSHCKSCAACACRTALSCCRPSGPLAQRCGSREPRWPPGPYSRSSAGSSPRRRRVRSVRLAASSTLSQAHADGAQRSVALQSTGCPSQLLEKLRSIRPWALVRLVNFPSNRYSVTGTPIVATRTLSEK